MGTGQKENITSLRKRWYHLLYSIIDLYSRNYLMAHSIYPRGPLSHLGLLEQTTRSDCVDPKSVVHRVRHTSLFLITIASTKSTQ